MMHIRIGLDPPFVAKKDREGAAELHLGEYENMHKDISTETLIQYFVMHLFTQE